MKAGGSVGAWLAMARASNLPTVISHALTGAATSAVDSPFPWAQAWAAAGAASFLYAGGAILNDVLDADVDRLERPTRPIPSGRVRRTAARIAAVLSLAAGAGVATAFGSRAALLAVILVVAILLYDTLHRFSAWTVLLLGLCRGLVVVLASSMAGAGPAAMTWCLAAMLGGYAVVLSIVARRETEALTPRALSWACWVLAAWPAWLLVLWFHVERVPGTIFVPATLGVMAWLALVPRWSVLSSSSLVTQEAISSPHVQTGQDRSTAAAVSAWLAGLALLDVLALIALGQMGPACTALGCFVAARLAQRAWPAT